MADYRKMYHVLLDAAERVLLLLEREEPGAELLLRAAAELIEGERRCEEIYLLTSGDADSPEFRGL